MANKQSLKQTFVDSKRNPATIMSELDRWVAAHGNGQYMPPDFEPIDNLALFPDYGSQQVRAELQDFVNEIVTQGFCGTMMEIGLGRYGSTHFLGRLLFQKVLTIEKSFERCFTFARNFSEFYDGVWPTSDGRSAFITGLSSDPLVVRKAYDATKRKIDLLFIDGDHRYDAVLSDWLLYHNLVHKGGIVAFHDSATDRLDQSEVPVFLAKLKNGEIDGESYSFQEIFHSRHAGISYYKCI